MLTRQQSRFESNPDSIKIPEVCTRDKLYSDGKIVTCFFCTQLCEEGGCVGRDGTCGCAPNKDETGNRNIWPISCAVLTRCWLLYVVSVSVFTTRGIVDCLIRCLTNRVNLSTFIAQRKIAAATPDHWSLMKIKRAATRLDAAGLVGLESTRLCWCVRLPACGHIEEAK